MVITFFLSPKSSDCFYTPTNSFKPKDSFAVGNNSEKPQILTVMKLENNKCWTIFQKRREKMIDISTLLSTRTN